MLSWKRMSQLLSEGECSPAPPQCLLWIASSDHSGVTGPKAAVYDTRCLATARAKVRMLPRIVKGHPLLEVDAA